MTDQPDNNADLYSTPTADLETQAEIEIPEEITKKIRAGWIAAVIVCVLTLVLALIGISDSSSFDSYASLIDLAVLAGLTFGVYKNSRTCAILLFLFYALGKAVVWIESGNVLSGLLPTLLFFWFLGNAIVGTFQYHSYLKEQRGSA